MIACTSPWPTSRSRPFRICLPSMPACKFLISSKAIRSPVTGDSRLLSHASFQRHAEQLLRFHRELHRKFAEHFATETADDHGHGVLGADAALLTVEELVLADL